MKTLDVKQIFNSSPSLSEILSTTNTDDEVIERKLSNAEKQRAYRLRNVLAGKRNSSGPSGSHKSPRTNAKPCKVTLQFVGWDGEGYDRHVKRQPEHVYTLLANSRGNYIANRDGISTAQALEFFLSESDKESAIHVGFAFSYDVNMVFRDLSDEELCNINDGEHTLWTGDDRRYQLAFRPRRFFDVKRFRGDRVYRANVITKGPNAGATRYNLDVESKIRIWDVFGFFQCSFVKALGSYFTDEELPELATIKDMKKKRSQFSAKDDEQVRSYCIKECEYLVKLMSRLRTYLVEVGIKNTQWHGTGAVASAVMRDAGVRKFLSPTPEAIRDVLLRAYSGGRIETTGVGRIKGQLWDYDLNSAYPSIQSDLPCLRCSKWTHSKLPASRWYLARIEYVFRHDLPWYPLFFRTEKGEIRYPMSGSGWYWQDEAEAALAFHEQTKVKGQQTKCRILEVWNLNVGCDHKPFNFLREQYRARQQMKANKNPAQQALKLSINSCYGKTMQQIGGTPDHPPPYFSLEWGGMITSGVRAKLVRAALTTSPSDILFFATDGILSKSQLQVPLGTDMNTWEIKNGGKPYDEAVIVIPGVYWLRSGVHWVTATRGFEDTAGGKPSHILRAWRSGRYSLNVKQTRFGTLRQSRNGNRQVIAIDRNKWRRWKRESRELNLLGASAKRIAYTGDVRLLQKSFAALSATLGHGDSHPYTVSNWRTGEIGGTDRSFRLDEDDDMEMEAM